MKLMKNSLAIFGALCAATIISAPVHAQEEALAAVSPGNAVLSVTGTGEVTTAPDIANFDVSVVSTGSTASQALQNNSRQMQNVFAALRRLGIAQKDIQTSSVSLQPQFQRFSRNGPQESQTPRITGYNASNSVRIIQRDLDKLGRTIDALVTAGANRVNGPTFGLANSDAERNRARVDAIKDARARAELYAGAAGLRVKRIMLISDQSPGIVRPQMRFARMEAADSSVPISPGEQAITASVSVMFELSPL